MGGSAASATSTTAAATTVLTVISGTEFLTTTSSTATASTTPTLEAEAMAHALQPLGHLLVVLLHQLDQLPRNVAILVVHKRKCVADVTHTTSSADAVHVVVDVGGQVEVDHLGDVGDIQASGSNVCRH